MIFDSFTTLFSHYTFFSTINLMFQKIDRDNDGVITYRELLDAVSDPEVITFMKKIPSLSPLLRPTQIKATMKTIVDSVDDDQLTKHAFELFATAVINDVDVSLSEAENETLDAINQLFVLLDTNNDGILSYSECMQGMSDSKVKTIINSQPALESLLHPREMRRTMKNIAKAHPSGALNRGAFRLFVAVQEN